MECIINILAACTQEAAEIQKPYITLPCFLLKQSKAATSNGSVSSSVTLLMTEIGKHKNKVLS